MSVFYEVPTQKGKQSFCCDCGKNVTWKTRHQTEESTREKLIWRCHDCWRRSLGRDIPNRIAE